MPEIAAPCQGKILIVDDNPANLRLLEDMLRQQGYEVRSFPRGRLALAAAEREPPDLILLDINMPEMNGYEVCERLKSSRRLGVIPVIFLSALSETEDKVKAFRSGAVDYVPKPFQFDEVQARVETQISLYRLQRALKSQNEELEDVVAVRTRELAEANRRLQILDRSKSDFLHLISHEFRTPLNGLLGVSDLLLEELSSSEQTRELRELLALSRRRILSILDDALLFTQIDVSPEEFKVGPVRLSQALNTAIREMTEFAHSHGITILPSAQAMDLVAGNEDLLVRALQALLETALKFSAKNTTVQPACETAGGAVRVIIDTVGPRVPDSALPKFFEAFSIGEAVAAVEDLGLSAPLAARILSLFGASASVMNRESSGIRLTVNLARAGQALPADPASGRRAG